jgi:hypothetical protein
VDLLQKNGGTAPNSMIFMDCLRRYSTKSKFRGVEVNYPPLPLVTQKKRFILFCPRYSPPRRRRRPLPAPDLKLPLLVRSCHAGEAVRPPATGEAAPIPVATGGEAAPAPARPFLLSGGRRHPHRLPRDQRALCGCSSSPVCPSAASRARLFRIFLATVNEP